MDEAPKKRESGNYKYLVNKFGEKKISSRYDWINDFLAFVNEECACYLLRSYLFSEPENVPVLENKKEQIDNFVETMLYFFQYREYSAKNIELMILAFQAGCGYQYSADHQ